jgi:hypothetical protein
LDDAEDEGGYLVADAGLSAGANDYCDGEGWLGGCIMRRHFLFLFVVLRVDVDVQDHFSFPAKIFWIAGSINCWAICLCFCCALLFAPPCEKETSLYRELDASLVMKTRNSIGAWDEMLLR